MQIKKAGFFGLGLIGGSLAKTIHRIYPKMELIAYDIDETSLKTAEAEQTVTRCSDLKDFCDCDILFLCAPVHTNVSFLEKIKPQLRADCILSDVGSVKGNIHTAIHKLGLDAQFIGGHPMAGSEKSGYANATAYLFENAYFILTPSSAFPTEQTLQMRDFFASLGTLPLLLTPECHDYVTAAISHVPHILAATLVNMVKKLDSNDETMKSIAAGGFKDITRIASSSPVMWQQVCMTNRDQILRVLFALKETLETIETAIRSQDSDAIFDFFASSKEYRDSFSNTDHGPLKRAHYLYCDLIDETGNIAKVAQLLADHAISLKNIGIVHNREDYEGVLRLEFYQHAPLEKAAQLLKEHHYTVTIPQQ
ncbi:MAG: prephenate dehydrogenase/arogenate dehydrogenase family protein [Lachnospiraceae bacterium]